MSTPDIAAQYHRPQLLEQIEAGLREAGVDPLHPSPDDLSNFDQFHTGGKRSVFALAELAEFQAGERVLDVGGGIGGPARLLAQHFGVDVTVLDLTPDFCRVGEVLTGRCRMSERVRFVNASALDMPLPSGGFDVVWTQHSTMNIPDKPRLYAEISRVLRAGGRLAMHEIVGGDGGEVLFPAPWSATPGTSFILHERELRQVIAESGLQIVQWQNVTSEGVEWFTRQLSPGGRLAPGMGDKARNLLQSYQQDRARVVRAVAANASIAGL